MFISLSGNIATKCQPRIIARVPSFQCACAYSTKCQVNTISKGCSVGGRNNSVGASSFPPKDFSVKRAIKRAISSTSRTDASVFTNLLPLSRLGMSHESLGSYLASVYPDVPRIGVPLPRLRSKEYTLVVVTESRFRRILLGRKLRGFGKGFFNSFGGHLDHTIDPTPSRCAVRELAEEANIHIPLDVMEEGAVGTLRFTFDDDKEKEMVVNLYRVDLICDGDSLSNNREDCNESSRMSEIEGKLPTFRIDSSIIQGCDEIEPQWFDNWYDIPLHNMFADDSIWLTKILSSDQHIRFDGWFHFCAGGTDINSIMHHHIMLGRLG